MTKSKEDMTEQRAVMMSILVAGDQNPDESIRKKKKKLHHSSHIRLIRRPIYKQVWNMCI
jgi:hypothetical protein